MIVIIASLIAALLVGVGLGYFLRHLITMGKKGSLELEIKQMTLEAKEKAQKITDEAETKARSMRMN
jgi:F0F1-type ATP synthase assembly protein I